MGYRITWRIYMGIIQVVAIMIQLGENVRSIYSVEISILEHTIRNVPLVGPSQCITSALSRSQISAVVVGALKLFRTPAALALGY